MTDTSDEIGPDSADADDAAVQEIARQHPSAGTDDQPEGEREADLQGDERAQDGSDGAGEDYAGSGY